MNDDVKSTNPGPLGPQGIPKYPPPSRRRTPNVRSRDKAGPRNIRLGITVGDPAGVGPEVALKALLGCGRGSGEELLSRAEILLIGPQWVFEDAIQRYGLRAHFTSYSREHDPRRIPLAPPGPPQTPSAAQPSQPPSNAKRPILPGLFGTNPAEETVPTFCVLGPEGCELPFEIPFGSDDALCGAIAYRAIEEAARLAREGIVDAIVTAPISKASLNAAGAHFPGHTELLQALTQSAQVGMMLAGGGLRVSLVTTHAALSKIPQLITIERVMEMIQLTHEFLRLWDCPSPRLGLAGLNPHCGEGGLFGDEEFRVLIPAAAQSRDRGIHVSNPIPSDTIFHRALQGEFDAVVALYHDQALIPIKTLDFDGGVNITMGLPILRTSPDHGTAFAIAGKGLARTSSMRNALLTALDLASRRRAHCSTTASL